jgi:hypothetical protein
MLFTLYSHMPVKMELLRLCRNCFRLVDRGSLGSRRVGIIRTIHAIFFLAALVAACPSFAEGLSGGATPPVEHDVLKRFREAGGTIEFLGHAYGTDGWLVTNPKGGVQYVYTLPDGAMVIGMLFAPDGTMETISQLKAYKERAAGSQTAAPGAEKAASKSERLYAEAENASWIRIGDTSAPYLYMFMNVSCDHCQEYWKDLALPVKAGKLQIRMIPFGATDANRDGGAALLSAEHPDAAWEAYIGGDTAVLGKNRVRDGTYFKVDANTALAKTWRLAPPFTLYRRPADGSIQAIVGRPENTMLVEAEFLKEAAPKPRNAAESKAESKLGVEITP